MGRMTASVTATDCQSVSDSVSVLQFSGSLGVNDPFLGALYPSKSGLMNNHIVKHIVSTTVRQLY